MKQYEVRKDMIQIPFTCKALPEYMRESDILEQANGYDGVLVLSTDDETAAKAAYKATCESCVSRVFGRVLCADVVFIRSIEDVFKDDGMHTIIDEYGYYAAEYVDSSARATDEDVDGFVYELMFYDDSDRLVPINTIREAQDLLDAWKADGIEYPIGTQPEQLLESWNENIKYFQTPTYDLA